jgi:hypothetical protein
MPESGDAIVRAGSSEVDTQKPREAVVKAQPAPRSIADIESDMAATRQRLAGTLEELKIAASPKNIVNRQVDKVKTFYIDEYGAVRVDRVAGTVGVVVAVIVVRRTWRRITH